MVIRFLRASSLITFIKPPIKPIHTVTFLEPLMLVVRNSKTISPVIIKQLSHATKLTEIALPLSALSSGLYVFTGMFLSSPSFRDLIMYGALPSLATTVNAGLIAVGLIVPLFAIVSYFVIRINDIKIIERALRSDLGG